MEKKEIKEIISEETVSGMKPTKRAQKVSGEENKQYYKEVEKKMGDYDKNLKQEDENSIEPVKDNIEGKEKEYHEDMEIMNGQEMIRYDGEPSDMFKERAKEAIVGSSKMGNKTYVGDENGNTEPVWGASDAEFGKKLVDRAARSVEKRNDATPTMNQFGDDIEAGAGAPKVEKRKIATESMKRLRFKKPFNGFGNALKLIPESFKQDSKVFEMTDNNETYRIKWEGSLTEGKAVILNASDKNIMSEDYKRIKNLMNYKSEDTLGTLTSKERVNENNILKNKIIK